MDEATGSAADPAIERGWRTEIILAYLAVVLSAATAVLLHLTVGRGGLVNRQLIWVLDGLLLIQAPFHSLRLLHRLVAAGADDSLVGYALGSLVVWLLLVIAVLFWLTR